MPTGACVDTDGDGYGEGCGAPDCDDSDPSIHPGALEDCHDHHDNDCNSAVDSVDAACPAGCQDSDGDGYGVGLDCKAPDCDDREKTVIGPITRYSDDDGDGYGDAKSTGFPACASQKGTVTDHTDCNDSEKNAHPGGTERCDAQNVDEDCNGKADDADADAQDKQAFNVDADGDGFGAQGETPKMACDAPAGGYVASNTDCDDSPTGKAIHPGAQEVCDDDDIDEDCDGIADDLDDSAQGRVAYYQDLDADGFGSPLVGTRYACELPPEAVDNADDCDDFNPNFNQEEIAYRDVDGDGFGSGDEVTVCSDGSNLPPGYVWQNDDCEDQNGDQSAMVNPMAAELPDDGVDQDCDGSDLEINDETTIFVDSLCTFPCNHGTRNDPVPSISRGLPLAAQSGKKIFAFAKGTYLAGVELYEMSLFGGYAHGFKQRDPTLYTTTLVTDRTDYVIRVSDYSYPVAVQGFNLRDASARVVVDVGYGGSLTLVNNFIEGGGSNQTGATTYAVYLNGGGTLRAIENAIGSKGPYDTVVMHLEDYSGGMNVVLEDNFIFSGDANYTTKGIELCASGAKVTLSHNEVFLGDSQYDSSAFTDDCGTDSTTAVTLQNNAFGAGDVTYGSSCAVTLASSRAFVQGNNLYAGPSLRTVGLQVGYDAVVTASSNYIEPWVGDETIGIIVRGASILMNNHVHGGQGSYRSVGISLEGYTNAVAILNNVIDGGTASDAVGLSKSDEQRPVLLNNGFQNTECLLSESGECVTEIVQVNNCALHHCADSGKNLSIAPEPESGFHLSEGSPLIDAGVNPAPWFRYTTLLRDHDDHLRPARNGFDIGLEELQ